MPSPLHAARWDCNSYCRDRHELLTQWVAKESEALFPFDISDPEIREHARAQVQPPHSVANVEREIEADASQHGADYFGEKLIAVTRIPVG